MIRMLIPVLDNGGAVEAARFAVFMFLERGITEVELLEVLEPVDQGRGSFPHAKLIAASGKAGHAEGVDRRSHHS